MIAALNVGSGQRRFVSTPEIEWRNVDVVSREGEEPDIVADAAHLPFEDASVDLVVSHHCYEHCGCNEANPYIQEAWRVLRPGGSLLVFVPDLKQLAIGWLTGKIDDYLYCVNLYGAYRDRESDRHRWGFSQDGLLRHLAEVCKWASVSRFDGRTIPGAALAQDWWIASAECVK